MKKRFIAGASCPECNQLDKIVMYDDENHLRWRECVSCGFKEQFIEPGAQSVDELKTRVNQAIPGEKPLAHEDEVSVVSILDPKKSLH